MSAVIERGYKSELYWIEETTEGTAPSGGTPLPNYNADYVFLEERITRELITHPTVGSRTFSFIDMGLKTYTLPVTLFPVNISLMDYAVSQVDSKTLTLYVKHPELNVSNVFSGCKINTLRLSGSAGTTTQAALEFWAVKHTSTAPNANFASLPTALPMHGRDSYVKIDANTQAEFRAWSVEISNNLERVPGLGSDEFRYVRPRNLVVTGELSGTWESTAHLNKLMNNTAFSLEIGLGKDSGGVVRKITIDGCKFREFPIPSRKTDLIMLRLPFQGKTVTLS